VILYILNLLHIISLFFFFVLFRSFCYIPYKELQIQEKIAEGSQGVIFRATWQGTDVVYKKLKCNSAQERVGLQRELAAWAYEINTKKEKKRKKRKK
jgi:predicted Ser/Thr protein kinase